MLDLKVLFHFDLLLPSYDTVAKAMAQVEAKNYFSHEEKVKCLVRIYKFISVSRSWDLCYDGKKVGENNKVR